MTIAPASFKNWSVLKVLSDFLRLEGEFSDVNGSLDEAANALRESR